MNNRAIKTVLWIILILAVCVFAIIVYNFYLFSHMTAAEALYMPGVSTTTKAVATPPPVSPTKTPKATTTLPLKQATTTPSTSADCPDIKIINKMPTVGAPTPVPYYIKNGQKRELSSYDSTWVATHCDVPEQSVF